MADRAVQYHCWPVTRPSSVALVPASALAMSRTLPFPLAASPQLPSFLSTCYALFSSRQTHSTDTPNLFTASTYDRLASAVTTKDTSETCATTLAPPPSNF